MTTVATENPNVKFIFIDGWPLTDASGNALANVTAVSYKEQESGFLAGYAAVAEGYTKLGFMGGGGGTNPACCRFGFGFAQGAQAAAIAKGLEDGAIELKYSWKYGESFSASNELQTLANNWYSRGTQVIFCCGGSMFDSVKAAATANADKNVKIIGVDVDQASEHKSVITSAVKGLSASVKLVLDKFYAGKWDSELGGKAQNLGAKEDATGLPTATESWRMTKFTVAEYNVLFDAIKTGTVVISEDFAGFTAENAETVATTFTKLAVAFEK